MITSDQIRLVRTSFEHVRPVADDMGVLLYERIFFLAPETRTLFGDDIRPQAKRLMAAMNMAVDKLDHLGELAPFLVKLGARHWHYGVRFQHFEVGSEALTWTLEQGLGDTFTPDVRAAWAAAWSAIADAMIIGLRSAARRESDEALFTIDDLGERSVGQNHPDRAMT